MHLPVSVSAQVHMELHRYQEHILAQPVPQELQAMETPVEIEQFRREGCSPDVKLSSEQP